MCLSVKNERSWKTPTSVSIWTNEETNSERKNLNINAFQQPLERTIVCCFTNKSPTVTGLFVKLTFGEQILDYVGFFLDVTRYKEVKKSVL